MTSRVKFELYPNKNIRMRGYSNHSLEALLGFVFLLPLSFQASWLNSSSQFILNWVHIKPLLECCRLPSELINTRHGQRDFRRSFLDSGWGFEFTLLHVIRAASDSVRMGLDSVTSQHNLQISSQKPILFGNHELKRGFFRDLSQWRVTKIAN